MIDGMTHLAPDLSRTLSVAGDALLRLIPWIDAVGAFVFALSGALLAVKKQYDVFGVVFLAVIVAIAGGMMRDVLIGAVPPAALTTRLYIAIAVAAGLVVFFLHGPVATMGRAIDIADAVGLSLIGVTGTQKALLYGIDPLIAAVLGMVSAVGGGIIRDLLAGETPYVFKGDLYALAALAAGMIVAFAPDLGLGPRWAMLAGGVTCLTLRLMSLYRGWKAPVARL